MNLSLPWLRQEKPPEQPPRAAAVRVVERMPDTRTDSMPWRWRSAIWLLALLLFGVLLSNGAEAFVRWLDQPVQEVRVQGLVEHLDRQALAERLALQVSAPLLSQDIRRLQQQAVADPWVHAVSVQRRWPAAIEVQITEEVAVARWGDVGLLNHQGDIFWPQLNTDQITLPRLNGPAHETRTVMQQYHDLSRLFSGTDLRLAGLTLEGRGAWTLELDNGIRIVAGREQLMPRLRRFITLYQLELHALADRIEQVDIRYTNGAAVQWRTEERLKDAG